MTIRSRSASRETCDASHEAVIDRPLVLKPPVAQRAPAIPKPKILPVPKMINSKYGTGQQVKPNKKPVPRKPKASQGGRNRKKTQGSPGERAKVGAKYVPPPIYLPARMEASPLKRPITEPGEHPRQLVSGLELLNVVSSNQNQSGLLNNSQENPAVMSPSYSCVYAGPLYLRQPTPNHIIGSPSTVYSYGSPAFRTTPMFESAINSPIDAGFGSPLHNFGMPLMGGAFTPNRFVHHSFSMGTPSMVLSHFNGSPVTRQSLGSVITKAPVPSWGEDRKEPVNAFYGMGNGMRAAEAALGAFGSSTEEGTTG